MDPELKNYLDGIEGRLALRIDERIGQAERKTSG
jgi:hypothetical protein